MKIRKACWFDSFANAVIGNAFLMSTDQYAAPMVKARSSSTKYRTKSTNAPRTGQIDMISVMKCTTPHANTVKNMNDKSTPWGPAVRNMVSVRT